MTTPDPMPRGRVLRRLSLARDVVFLVLVLGTAVLHFTAFRDYVFEDAYITYRYADNLASGNGFVFNPGERVFGTTTPFYTLLLAALAVLGCDVPTAGGVIYALGLSLVALLGAHLLRRRGHPNAAVVYGLVVLSGAGEALRYFGMETALYTCLLLATLLAAESGRRTLAGVLLGLAFLTRYDAFMLTVALLPVLWIEDRRIPWRTYLAAAAVVLPWLVFAQLYFGSVLPQTLSAKADQVDAARYMYQSVARLTEDFFSPIRRVVIPFPYPNVLTAALLLALVAPIFSQTAAIARRGRFALLALAVSLLLWLGYSAIGPPLAHGWYLLPALYLFVWFACLAWATAVAGWSRPRAEPWLAAAVLVLGIASFVLLPWGITSEVELRTLSATYQRRVEAYRLFARWIGDHGVRDLVLFTREPGYLAFLSHNPVIDGGGLVSPEVSELDDEPGGSLEETLRALGPELAVVNARELLDGAPAGYRPLLDRLARSLYIREDLYQERFPTLAARFLERGFAASEEVSLGHPLVFDFAAGDEGWTASWGRSFRSQPLTLPSAAGVFTGPVLHSQTMNPVAILESPPFRIDFDVLRFLWSGDQASGTWGELQVNGVRVLTVRGRHDLDGRLEEVSWPVHAWRGQVGVLRFFDVSRSGVVAVARVSSHRFTGAEVFDDFESGAWSERWKTRIGPVPCTSEELGRRYGLAAVLGRFTASSLCKEGTRALLSHPFRVGNDHLAFAVLDQGGSKARIELETGGGRVTHRYKATGAGVVAVSWDLSKLRGEEVVLRLLDNDPDLESGLGIDDLVFYDGLDP